MYVLDGLIEILNEHFEYETCREDNVSTSRYSAVPPALHLPSLPWR